MQTDRQLERADEYGRVLANMIREEGKDASIPREFWAYTLAAMRDNLGRDLGGGDNLTQWTSERYWGLQTKKFIPQFLSVYEQLVARNFTEDNKLVYNDTDYKIWVEPHPTLKIVVFEDGFSGSKEDNVYLFIMDESDHGFSKFHIRTAYAKANKAFKISGWSKYDRVSLKTHRKYRWKLQYGDSRDHGYVLSYTEYYERIDYNQTENWITHAMWLMGTAHDELGNEHVDD